MNTKPHFVLFSGIGEQSQHDEHGGSWHFLLKSTTNSDRFEASDVEPGVSRERLELLATVRGLEAIEQPSRVTLVTSSRKISRAIRIDLHLWRSEDWTWERFGERVTINHCDLWQRIDRALSIHDVSCRRLRVDEAHRTVAAGRASALPKPHIRRRRKQQGDPLLLRPLFAVVRGSVGGLHRFAEWLNGWLPERQTSMHAGF